jgi:hypothetical protein
MLLRIIDRRGVAISSHDRERVMGCADASGAGGDGRKEPLSSEGQAWTE